MPTYKIVNVKSRRPYDIYCGRANKTYGLPQSKWANPYVIGVDGTRAEVIAKFEKFLLGNHALMAALPELFDKTLACWCDYPKEDCHCRVIAEQVEKFKNNL